MNDKGIGATDIAINLGIGRSTVYKIRKEHPLRIRHISRPSAKPHP
ncbi:MAG: helix-turn-helix domain-containing protein [Nitrosomonas sp.]|jgi:DNA invertase Pin-like site-specific DNA recombinase|nr:helix-turn-helix domain-containing protein [Nitrosomonas sp.]